jgi:hypothetical protein
MTNRNTQVNAGLKAYAKILFELFCAARVPYPWPKEAFNGSYFTIFESIILCIADDLVVGCGDIVSSECAVALNNNFREFNLFDKLGSPPASLFVSCQGDVVITSRACECKIISKLAGNHAPIFLFISQKISPDRFVRVLRFGRNCHDAKHNRK